MSVRERSGRAFRSSDRDAVTTERGCRHDEKGSSLHRCEDTRRRPAAGTGFLMPSPGRCAVLPSAWRQQARQSTEGRWRCPSSCRSKCRWGCFGSCSPCPAQGVGRKLWTIKQHNNCAKLIYIYFHKCRLKESNNVLLALLTPSA